VRLRLRRNAMAPDAALIRPERRNRRRPAAESTFGARRSLL